MRIGKIIFCWCQAHYFRNVQFWPWKPNLVQNNNSHVMNLQSYGPRIRDFLLLIWPVWLHQVFKHRDEKCFREIAHIKLPVNAQVNLQSLRLNYHTYHHGRAEEVSPFSTQFLHREIITKRKCLHIDLHGI